MRKRKKMTKHAKNALKCIIPNIIPNFPDRDKKKFTSLLDLKENLIKSLSNASVNQNLYDHQPIIFMKNIKTGRAIIDVQNLTFTVARLGEEHDQLHSCLKRNMRLFCCSEEGVKMRIRDPAKEFKELYRVVLD